MHNKKCSTFVSIVAIVMIIVLTVPLNANATTIEPVHPRASAYLNAYSAYVYPAGSGRIEVYFFVSGTEYMDEIGTLRISLYESKDNNTWTWVKTYSNENHSSMLGYNKKSHNSSVTYQGIGGRYYKAYIGVWAGKDGAGDTRYFWTSAKQAI